MPDEIIEFTYEEGRKRWGAELADEIWCYFHDFDDIALLTGDEAVYMDSAKNLDAARPTIWRIGERSGADV